MPMVEWLVVVHSDASSSCPIVRTDASHMVVGQTTSLEACGEPRSWGSPSREQGGQKRSMSAQMRVASKLHKLARPERAWRCSISQMASGEARVQALVGGPIGLEAHINGTDASRSG